ncbi:MAG: hypothetical protein AVDCRST_MAG73-2744 [uncultured Thermomicrobiales bacterium]|uniref:Uncharacterized protein n=1 Tax=uncultured Thermomicrobiales bacterium TaxID=1645740 RepID=A0A6J4UFJ1_9BACT|nr:MAG: hypothetical protein AVDCRST_MAG73-2744 [uncultured Thermomicrobiales bacterium]
MTGVGIPWPEPVARTNSASAPLTIRNRRRDGLPGFAKEQIS